MYVFAVTRCASLPATALLSTLQLKKAMEEFAEHLKAKERELLDHIKKHNIRQTSDIPRAKGQGSGEAARSSGVLV